MNGFPVGREGGTRRRWVARLSQAPLPSFWKLFLPLAVVPLGIILVFYEWVAEDFFDRLETLEAVTLESQARVIGHVLTDVVADALILAEQNELRDFLATGDRARLPQSAAELLSFSRYVGVYDQVRFIDASGQEIVRVNRNGGNPVVVAEAALQDKEGRYYFEEALGLERGQVYLSALDLNIERGVVEIPYKPMIRVGTPVVDADGRTLGIILVNYLAQDLLDTLSGVGRMSSGVAMLLNQEGYWLLAPDASQSWGFMFPGGEERRLEVEDPIAWSRMTQQPSGHFYTARGLYTYRWLDLVEEIGLFMSVGISAGMGAEPRRWCVLTRVPRAFIDRRRAEILLPLGVSGAVVLGLLAIGLRAIITVMAERRRRQKHLERLASLDTLTGIANRRTFEERLMREMARTDRHGRRCALLMIDLDGFKAVNDTQGHQVGDQVLKDVAKLLGRTLRVRSEDVVARFGGDEFAVLLCELGDAQTALAVAEMIRARIGRLAWGGQSVSASIGVALYPDHAGDMPELFRVADAAMYGSKRAGKDRIRLAERPSDT